MRLEYSGRRPFAQPRRLGDARFYGLLWEVARWLRTARLALASYDETTLTALSKSLISRRSLDELECENWSRDVQVEFEHDKLRS